MDPIHIHVCLAHSPSRAHALFTKLVNFKLKSINQHTLFSDKIADSPFNRAHRELFAVLLSSLCWIVCMLQWLVIVFNEKKNIISYTHRISLPTCSCYYYMLFATASSMCFSVYSHFFWWAWKRVFVLCFIVECKTNKHSPTSCAILSKPLRTHCLPQIKNKSAIDFIFVALRNEVHCPSFHYFDLF